MIIQLAHHLRPLRSVNELDHSQALPDIPLLLRSHYKIAVIDDKRFDHKQRLERNNFQIRIFRDIFAIPEIEDYPIVCCDIHGVGLNLDTELQGVHIINQIKRNYPTKVIVAYTAQTT